MGPNISLVQAPEVIMVPAHHSSLPSPGDLSSTGKAGQAGEEGHLPARGGEPPGMGNWASGRKLEETEDEELKSEPARGSQGVGFMKFLRRGQWAVSVKVVV